MRMSCNGCRVLRKGCSDNCSIRPCLQWIKNPESQANATVFLAKFYGRAGLMNLINAGPEHLRPAIFRSLLYEACGRIVNPIYGSVGLLWSGSWQLCQAAVEAVLKGAPITQIPTETAANTPTPPLKAYDIRHVLRPGQDGPGTGSGDLLHKVNKSSRTRFKRSGAGACTATEDSNNNNSGARNSTSPDSHRASPPALLRLGGAGRGGVSAAAACGTGMGLEEEGEYDHDDHHADAAERVAGGVGFDGFDHESSDSQHDDNESADERGFHELRLLDTAGVGGSATETVVGPRHGSGESVCGSAENHHHDSPDASMVTSHNHGGLTSEEDEDHDRDSGHHQDGGDADEDDGEVELELTLGGPKRRRS